MFKLCRQNATEYTKYTCFDGTEREDLQALLVKSQVYKPYVQTMEPGIVKTQICKPYVQTPARQTDRPCLQTLCLCYVNHFIPKSGQMAARGQGEPKSMVLDRFCKGSARVAQNPEIWPDGRQRPGRAEINGFG